MNKKTKVLLSLLIIVSFVMISNLTVFAEDLGSWTKLTDMPTPKKYLGAAVIDNKIYVVGGYDSSFISNKIQVYDLTTDTWLSDITMPYYVNGAGIAAVNNKIYIVGGASNTQQNGTAVVEEYDPSTNTWTAKSSMPTTGRKQVSIIVLNNKIYAIGGCNNTTRLNTTEVYDPATDTWEVKSNMNYAREGIMLGTVNGKIYAIGGNNGLGTYYKEIEEYDPVLDKWTVKPSALAGNAYAGSISVNNKIYIVGGYSGTIYYNKLLEYDPSNSQWNEKATLLKERSAHAVVLVDNNIYAIGGMNSNGLINVGSFEMYTFPVLIPTSPNNLIAAAGDAQVTLTWDTMTNVSGYNVKRAPTSGGPYDTIATNVTDAVYSDSTVTNGTTYYYIVTAVNPAGESEPSTEVSATPFKPVVKPNAPINLVSTGGDSKVDLTWSATEGASTYTVKRSSTAGGPYTITTDNLTSTSYTDTNVTNGTKYYYIVTAKNTAGESDPSNEASATPEAAQTPQPTGNRAILVITMTNGTIAEYDLSTTEANAFVKWYEDKANGTGKAVFTIKKNSNVLPFLSRKDYINFDKIYSFEVKEYKSN